MYQYVLFDLDGTLTDSMEGIINCVIYALEKMGREDLTSMDLNRFIGPPLMYSFQEFCGFNYEDAKKATALYRERFEPIGMFENAPYEGILQMLEEVKSTGKTLALATSKPQAFAKTICDHFNITPYLDLLIGADFEGKRESKVDVIKTVLAELNLSDEQLKQTIMIGDRNYDILGAKECSLDSIGVKWGYSKGSELEDAGATYTFDTITQLKEFLLKY